MRFRDSPAWASVLTTHPLPFAFACTLRPTCGGGHPPPPWFRVSRFCNGLSGGRAAACWGFDLCGAWFARQRHVRYLLMRPLQAQLLTHALQVGLALRETRVES